MAAGAGTPLFWSIEVDNQYSICAFTRYAPPTIYALHGPGVLGASVYGGQQVTIIGVNFGPASHTYGVR
jgi:hypothetical protein